ncbi:hypothetical protein IV38_GL000721 [Lactobacillus selangorensis]|uniref:Uncharacterized protein n=1 Tax=Lactobacillus selangorensis TaxID=81857 RepID=A0A0R2FRA1_9LACO|nr:Gfo/Idh/MocA family oxidoreductase [Lactobacillus selangorensis]KRN27229.1 hypothetical protein IV38_GL000721 [Lactobacillus selangorensis]KRN29849.1 hypothetical protein IV40_GL000557 [Lactobacillus selangorensis]
MLRIADIGLGNIAQKAYLPVMAQLQDRVEWHMVTRNPDKLAHLQKKDGFPYATHQLDALDALDLDAVFIHTPTQTHYRLVKRFLEQGINVYVDKPLSENLAEVEELYQLATAKHVLLTVGFNRRFAPLNQKLHAVKDKQLIQVEKTREKALDPVTFTTYDLFIHVIDTALYLADFPQLENPQYWLHADNGAFQQGTISLQTKEQQITMTLNCQAGTNRESSRVETPFGIDTVTDLSTYTTDSAQTKSIHAPSDWMPTLERRGFQPLILAFIKALETNGQNPVSPASSLLSHQLCTDFIRHTQL